MEIPVAGLIVILPLLVLIVATIAAFRPLDRLASGIRGLTEGNYDAKVDIDSDDEFDEDEEEEDWLPPQPAKASVATTSAAMSASTFFMWIPPFLSLVQALGKRVADELDELDELDEDNLVPDDDPLVAEPPHPINWNLLTSEEAEAEWLELNKWVNWLRTTYGLPASVVPPFCRFCSPSSANLPLSFVPFRFP